MTPERTVARRTDLVDVLLYIHSYLPGHSNTSLSGDAVKTIILVYVGTPG